MTKPDRAVIETDAFSICVLPSLGAAIGRFAWRHPDGDWRDLFLRPTDDEIDDVGASLSRLSSFIMLPYVNRIDAARFSFDGVEHRLEMNRPEQNCSIHGLARDRAWRVVEQAGDRLVCELIDESGDWPVAYAARQTIAVDGGSVIWDLAVENCGEAAAPFGFGLHPWFPRTDASTIAFNATTTFESNVQTLPTSEGPIGAEVDFASPRPIAGLPGMDRHYAGWGGEVKVAQPDFGYGLDLTAPATPNGAYRNVHIFCPTDRAAFCIEPVTHVTDVINRREFAQHGDMARLRAGETLSARFVVTPEAL